ncbi:MAG: calcium:proton exchanger [Clostridiaceae bacterium]|nr:calcium:proton exchanger [Clostridiaceae bacterium]
MERRHTRVSYVKKPLAKRSFMSIGLAAAGLCLFAAGMYLSIKNQGQAPLNVAAMVFCSLILNLVGVWYGALSFLEKEKNYILAKVGIVVGGLEIFAWILIMIVGIGG